MNDKIQKLLAEEEQNNNKLNEFETKIKGLTEKCDRLKKRNKAIKTEIQIEQNIDYGEVGRKYKMNPEQLEEFLRIYAGKTDEEGDKPEE